MSTQLTTSKIILWSARILGSLILAFVGFMVLAHVFGEEESGEGFRNTKEVLMFICFPIGTLIGLILAYKWEGLGGLITTISILGLMILRPDLWKSVVMLIPALPGILYMTYWAIKRSKSDNSIIN